MREIRTHGSVRGAFSNGRPYRVMCALFILLDTYYLSSPREWMNIVLRRTQFLRILVTGEIFLPNIEGSARNRC